MDGAEIAMEVLCQESLRRKVWNCLKTFEICFYIYVYVDEGI
jgi:hypothetical protein